MHSYAYLIAALAFTTPAMMGVKYSLNFLKGLLPTGKNPDTKANITRLYAVALGALILPGLSAAAAYVGITPVYDVHEAPFDVVAGAAAGLLAIGDYHLSALLQGVVSGSVQGLPFFGPAQSSGPNPQQTVTGGSQPGFPPSNSIPEPPPPTP